MNRSRRFLLSRSFAFRSRPGGRRSRRTGFAARGFAVAAGVLLARAPLSAADLVVQGSNSPYPFTTGTASYGNIYVGNTANGTLAQSGGTLTQSGNNTGCYLGYNAGVTGTYNLSNGTLNTFFTFVGNSGTGVFNQTGGTGAYLNMNIGVNAGSVGTYNQSAGTVTSTTSSGPGGIELGYNAGSVGTYNLSGTGQVNAADGMIVGDHGTGTFNQTGGTLAFGNYYILLGSAAGSSGTYTLGGGVFQSPGAQGGSGTSAFHFAGGTLQATGSNGSFLQSLTTADVRGNGGAIIDSQGFGITIAQGLVHDTSTNAPATDGGLTKLGTGTLTLTGANTYTGPTTVSAGNLAITAGGVGTSGGGTATVSVDGTGTGAAAATASLSGSAALKVAGDAFVGQLGTGAFTQSGGTATVGGQLFVAAPGGASTATTGVGTYTLSGGTLQTGYTQLGNFGKGTFTQTGGTQTITGGLYAGLNGGTGTYNLQAGSFQTVFETIGYTNYTTAAGVTITGSGTFTQTGGNVSVSSIIDIGDSTVGIFNLSAGTTTVGTYGLNVGYHKGGVGTVNQSGGTLDASGAMESDLALDANAQGTYNLSGGTLLTSALAVGSVGMGVFNQTGGTFTTAQYLLVGDGAGSTGTYNLNAGTLTTPSVRGNAGTSTFNFNGGTLQAGASATNFLQNLTHANVQAGGAIINTAGFNVTVAQALASGTASGTADGGLTKLGMGTLTLTGTNTYTGPTTVSAGTLLADNTAGSATGTGAVSVRSGGTLGGTGAAAGAVTVQSGGHLDAGNAGAAGMLSLASGLSLNNGATLGVELGGTTPGTGYDQVRVAGALTLGGTLSVTEPNGFKLSLGQTFVILDDTGTSLHTTTFANVPVGGLYTDAAGNKFLVNYAAAADADLVPNDVTLTVVSEPSTWALLGVGTAGLVVVTLRRHQAARA